MLRPTRIAAILTLVALVTTSSHAVQAQQVPGGRPNPRAKVGQQGLSRLDADKNGQVSKQEFERVAARVAQKRGQGGKAGPMTAGRVFDRLDADKNGELSPAELAKLKQLRARTKGTR